MAEHNPDTRSLFLASDGRQAAFNGTREHQATPGTIYLVDLVTGELRDLLPAGRLMHAQHRCARAADDRGAQLVARRAASPGGRRFRWKVLNDHDEQRRDLHITALRAQHSGQRADTIWPATF
ncbi:hypothetical protein HC891_23960 [Candidatus Gracilibacteria bacterium]|nr:hypothetical protein [Candidatus Gracilibacteria bacterium]